MQPTIQDPYPPQFVSSTKPPLVDPLLYLKGVRYNQANKQTKYDTFLRDENQKQSNFKQTQESSPFKENNSSQDRRSNSLSSQQQLPFKQPTQNINQPIIRIPRVLNQFPPVAPQYWVTSSPQKQVIQPYKMQNGAQIQATQKPFLQQYQTIQILQQSPLKGQQTQIRQQTLQNEHVGQFQQLHFGFPPTKVVRGRSVSFVSFGLNQKQLTEPSQIINHERERDFAQVVEQQAIHKSEVMNLNTISASSQKEQNEKVSHFQQDNKQVKAFSANSPDKFHYQFESQDNLIDKLKDQIEEITLKLELKEQEASILAQHVNERRELKILKQEIENNLNQTKIQISKIVENKFGGHLSEFVIQQQGELLSLNQKIELEKKDNGQIQGDLMFEKQINIQLREQINEKDYLISTLQSQLKKYQSQSDLQSVTSNYSVQQENIKAKRQEQENQVQLLKIQSLERNLVILEKENRKLREQNHNSISNIQ